MSSYKPIRSQVWKKQSQSKIKAAGRVYNPSHNQNVTVANVIELLVRNGNAMRISDLISKYQTTFRASLGKIKQLPTFDSRLTRIKGPSGRKSEWMLKFNSGGENLPQQATLTFSSNSNSTNQNTPLVVSPLIPCSEKNVIVIDCASFFRSTIDQLCKSRSSIVVDAKCNASGSGLSVLLLSCTLTKVSFVFDFTSSAFLHTIKECHIQLLKQLFEDDSILKFCHNTLEVSKLVYIAYGIRIQNCFDIGLAREFITHMTSKAPGNILETFPWHIIEIRSEWFVRPFDQQVKKINDFVNDMYEVLDVIQDFLEDLQSVYCLNCNATECILKATAERCERIFSGNDSHLVVFNAGNSYKTISYELAHSINISGKDFCKLLGPLVVKQDLDLLLSLIPNHFLKKLEQGSENMWSVRDIVLDLGQRPYMYTNHERVFLCDDENSLVTAQILEDVVSKLGGRFGQDNRAGFDRQLHRISAIRNNQRVIYGMTLRVGRHIQGYADTIEDILFGLDSSKSILIVGRPGCGKTTIIREVARKLSESPKNLRVLIVDTSNEIAGDGNVVHPSVGMARRMMVPDVGQQEKVMIECLQNHTPDVIIIDEIGRSQEVSAAKTVKERDVRLFASAHGDFHSLVRNPQLNGLLGGVVSSTLGDVQARLTNKGNKNKTERAEEPIFDIVIEVEPGDFESWVVIKDVGKAVDNILKGVPYEVEVRKRGPEKYGAVCIQKYSRVA